MVDQDQAIEKKEEALTGKSSAEFEDSKTQEAETSTERKIVEGEVAKAENDPKEEAPFEKVKEKIQTGSAVNDNDDDDDDDRKKVVIDADEISKMDGAENQIQGLVKLAIEKDPIVAINVAKHLDENYVLDEFHDKLMEDEIRKVLVEKGLLSRG